jgi:hypothetical protein
MIIMAFEFIVYISPVFFRGGMSPRKVAILIGIGLRFGAISILLYFVFLKEENPLVLRPEQTWHRKDFAGDIYGK